MKKVLIFFLLTFTVCLSLAAQKDANALKILDAMSDKYRKMAAFRANFNYVLYNEETDTRDSQKGEIIVMGDKYKLVAGPLEKYNDGKTVWTYYNNYNEVNIENYVPGESELSPIFIFSAYKKNFKYSIESESTIEGRTAYIIRLVPEKQDQFPIQFQWLKVYIDKMDYTLWGWQTLDQTGNTYTVSISGFDPYPGAGDAIFQFDASKHPGVYVSDLRDSK